MSPLQWVIIGVVLIGVFLCTVNFDDIKGERHSRQGRDLKHYFSAHGCGVFYGFTAPYGKSWMVLASIYRIFSFPIFLFMLG